MANTVNTRLGREALERSHRLARQLAAESDSPVALSDAILAAATYALEHVPEVARLLPRTD